MTYKKRWLPKTQAFVDGIIARQTEEFEETKKELKRQKKKIADPNFAPTTIGYRYKSMVDFNLILYLHINHHYRLEYLLLGQPPKKPE